MAPCGCRRWLSISEGTGQILKLFRIDHPIEATILGGATDGSTRRRQNSRETGCPSQALSQSNVPSKRQDKPSALVLPFCVTFHCVE
jgi:hypothetical protein